MKILALLLLLPSLALGQTITSVMSDLQMSDDTFEQRTTTITADSLFYFDSSKEPQVSSLTSAARGLLDDADASAMRTTLGLGTLATQNGTIGDYQPLDSDLTSIAALTTLAFGRSLLETTNSAAVRTLLSTTGVTPSNGTGGLLMQTSPTIVTPTITGAITFQVDIRQEFNPGSVRSGFNVGDHGGNPSSLTNGDLWYNSATNTLNAYIDGGTVSLGAGGGITDGDTLTTGLTFPTNGLKIRDDGAGTDVYALSVTNAATASHAWDWTLPDDDVAVTIGTSSVSISNTNTGDITLAGTPDYLTLSGQVITRNAIDLTTDVTGTLPTANGGRGNSNDANVAYVRSGATGGTVGNAATPFGTINAAKAAMTAPFMFDLDDGAHSLDLTVADLATTDLYYFRGSGPNTEVTINCTGAEGVGSAGEDIVFGDGASPLIVQSDHSCTIKFLVQAGNGDTNGGDFDGGNISGRLHLKNVIANLQVLDGGLAGGAGVAGTTAFDDLSAFNSQITNASGRLTASLDSVVAGAFTPSLSASSITSGTLGVANGGTGATTLTANAVLLGNGTSAIQAVAPSTSGNVLTSNGTTWTSAAPSTGANPAGSGSELQFRSDATTFGAVTNSSVSGGTLTLGNAEALGTTPTAYLALRNTTAAAAGAQQVSPSLVLEGQGWKTTATAASQTVRFRQNVLPVQGATNPSATLQFQSEINNSGTWTTNATLDSAGVLSGTEVRIAAENSGLFLRAAGSLGIRANGNQMIDIRNNQINFGANWLGWASAMAAAVDVRLGRGGANILYQANTSNAQTFRIYETDGGANSEYLELTAASGTNLIRPQATGTGTASVVRYHTTTAVFWTSGSGSPESVVTAPVGSMYTDTAGGAGTTLYVKESGTGSTGWIAK